jgi:hypothetical protein
MERARWTTSPRPHTARRHRSACRPAAHAAPAATSHRWKLRGRCAPCRDIQAGATRWEDGKVRARLYTHTRIMSLAGRSGGNGDISDKCMPPSRLARYGHHGKVNAIWNLIHTTRIDFDFVQDPNKVTQSAQCRFGHPDRMINTQKYMSLFGGGVIHHLLCVFVYSLLHIPARKQ